MTLPSQHLFRCILQTLKCIWQWGWQPISTTIELLQVLAGLLKWIWDSKGARIQQVPSLLNLPLSWAQSTLFPITSSHHLPASLLVQTHQSQKASLHIFLCCCADLAILCLWNTHPHSLNDTQDWAICSAAKSISSPSWNSFLLGCAEPTELKLQCFAFNIAPDCQVMLNLSARTREQVGRYFCFIIQRTE